MTLVLLLALILPLQSFAASWSCSAHDSGVSAAHHHCANDSAKAANRRRAAPSLRHVLCRRDCLGAVSLDSASLGEP